MIRCTKCGSDGHPEGATFCFSCGTELAPPACSHCGAAVVEGGRFCPSCGAVVEPGPDAAPMTPESGLAARRLTSVLFGDLVGFTSLSESRDPEEVRELLSDYFEECRAVIVRYGGVVEKFIGDAVMAVWGLPTTREDDAERAVRAGLELVARVAALGDRLGLADLALRVGIVTGEVAVTIGAENQGMVAGDPVNTAARVQAAAPPGQVWVDDTTRLLSSGSIDYSDAGSHVMKGKVDPVPLWSVRAVVTGVGGGHRGGLEAPLVGRERELRLIKEVFHGVEESGRPAMLVVDGEPGVGKSRLAWEFEKYADGLHTSARWHTGRCLSYGEGVAYYALAEAVRGRLASVSLDPAAAPESDLATIVALGVECWVAEEDRDWITPRLGALLGIDAELVFPREDLFSAWTAFFGAVARAEASGPEPVVIVIEDAQYADDGLLAFLEHLLGVADFPVFVLMLARPGLLEATRSLVTNRRVTVVHLEALTDQVIGRLLDGLVVGLPQVARDDLVSRAEGIPIFAIETVRSLIDLDLVVAQGGHYVLADPDRLDLASLAAPATLQALIAARLDTLPRGARTVVDRASVLGLGFGQADIAELCPDVSDLEAALALLVRQQVLRRETDRLSPERGQFRFVQTGVRQVAYGMLSRRDRKSLHLAAFQSLDDRPDAVVDLAPIMAQHLVDAIDAVPEAEDVGDLSALVSRHLQRAARRAGALGAPAEAAAHLEAALGRAPAEDHLTITTRLAEELVKAGQYERAITHATLALSGWEDVEDDMGRAAATAVLSRSHLHGRGDAVTAERLARECYQAMPDDAATLRVRLDLVTCWGAGLLALGSDTRECAEEHILLAERTQDLRVIADSWLLFAIDCFERGRPTLGKTLLDRAIDIGRETHDSHLLTVCLVNACAMQAAHDLKDARDLAREVVAIAARLGDQMWHETGVINAATVAVLRGDWHDVDILTEGTIADFRLHSWQELNRCVVGHARGAPRPTMTEVAAADDHDGGLVGAAGRSAIRALEAAAAGDSSAPSLASDAAEAMAALTRCADDFIFAWLIGVDLAWRFGDRASLDRLSVLVSSPGYLPPPAVRCQMYRLGPAPLVEAELIAALGEAVAWGSKVYEAHIRADLAVWLRRQHRLEEAELSAAQAREIYDGLGAAAWMEALDTAWASAARTALAGPT